jgi:hypothetical protein
MESNGQFHSAFPAPIRNYQSLYYLLNTYIYSDKLRAADPGFYTRWRRDVPYASRPALGPPSSLYNGYRVFPEGGWEWLGCGVDNLQTSSVEVKERVEL